MAARNIAFDAPDNATHSGDRAGACGGRPVDLDHLARQTMGDKALEIEVLQLFARQSRDIARRFTVEDPEIRREAAHRLKGAALAIGAFPAAAAAAAVEAQPSDADSLAALSAVILETEIFILRLCR